VNTAVISIGSNINADRNIGRALTMMAVEVAIVKTSDFDFTKPIGFKDQPDFLNGAALVETDMTMDAFARFLKDVEKSLKRERTENKFGPRTIDLDIVVWNNAVIDDDVYTRGFLKKAVKFLIPDIF